MSPILDYSYHRSPHGMEKNEMSGRTMSGTRGLQAAVINAANAYGTVPSTYTKRQTTIQRSLPWVDWKDLGVTASGTRDYLGTVPLQGFHRQEGFIFINNIDCYLYIGVTGNASSLISNPEMVVPPFSSGYLPTDLDGLTLLARCAGYDFTSARAKADTNDTRFSQGIGIEVKTANSSDPLPKLRTTWTRIYDKYDLTLNNPLTTIQVNDVWYSPGLSTSGSTNITVYGALNLSAAPGSNVSLYIVGTFIAGTGNFQMLNSGTAIQPTGPGLYYMQFSASGPSTPVPFLEWYYTPGGTPGVNAALQDILVTIAMGS